MGKKQKKIDNVKDRINKLTSDFEARMQLWKYIAEDPQALKDRKITAEEAKIIGNYYKGVRDGLVSVKTIMKEEL